MLKNLLQLPDFQELSKKQQQQINGGNYCPTVSNTTANGCTRIVRRCGGSDFGGGHDIVTFRCGNGLTTTTVVNEI